MHSVTWIAMSTIVLHGAQVHAGVRPVVAARAAQHVRVDILQTRSRPCYADWIVDRLARHRLPSLGNEKPRELVGARAEVAFDRAQLITRDRLLYRERILQTLHPDTRLLKIDLVAS